MGAGLAPGCNSLNLPYRSLSPAIWSLSTIALIRHPDTTFYGRVRGDSMINAGICDGDILVIDRSIEPHNGDVVVAYYDNKFTVKFFDNTHIDEGYINLVPANPSFETFRITADDDLTIWGVVQYTIKDWRRK